MGITVLRWLSLVLFIVGTIGVVLGDDQGGCQSQVSGLAKECAQYVLRTGSKIPPSKACCELINTIDIPCLCNHATKEIEVIVSMEKVVYVAGLCGKALPRGGKCGSFTIPPA
ncbi:hypothetical protein MKW92_028449 [Papaver armeniacum]|nr:hypothetical protein MKW92_028449 [Papaver armeniacum]